MKWLSLILILLITGFGLIFLIYSYYQEETDIIANNVIEYDGYHTAFYQDKEFYGGLEVIETDNIIQEKVYGGIVSHHMLISSEIARFFLNLKEQNPKTIVILGPNHYGLGSNLFISKHPFKTPWGLLEPDLDVIDALIQVGYVENQERPFEMEHSISSFVGFIKYVFPDAKIAPVILSRKTSKDQLDKFAEELDKILSDDALVISSVDFSHHLNRIVSNFHDKKSISAINSFDFDNIFNLEIDSPPSIYVLLKYLEKRNAFKTSHLVNTNAADYSGILNMADVTSYVFEYFIKGPKKDQHNIALLNFGDAMFDREVKNVMNQGIDPFEYIKGIEGNFLKGVDYISLNLEGPITSTNQCQKKSYCFKFEPKIANLLSWNNINIVNLANNHIFDCYEQGIEDTKEYLDALGVDYFGQADLSNSYVVKELNEKKIAFLGIDQTITPIAMDHFYDLIKQLKEDNNYVVVNIHWGYEYSFSPSKIQKQTAYNLIDSGADVVIGHHSHVVQPVEIYNNRAIFYSLGNFIFDMLTKETNEGIGVGVVLDENNYSFYLFPYEIINSQPKLFSYDRSITFCNQFLKDVINFDDCSFSLLNN